MTRVMTLILFVCMTSNVWADTLPQTSLFLAPDELAQLDSTRQHEGDRAIQDSADLRLDAIMYYTPDNWTLWIDGERLTPHTTRADIRILDVSEQSVRLAYRSDPGHVFKEFTLYPHQTYQAATDTIVQRVVLQPVNLP